MRTSSISSREDWLASANRPANTLASGCGHSTSARTRSRRSVGFRIDGKIVEVLFGLRVDLLAGVVEQGLIEEAVADLARQVADGGKELPRDRNHPVEQLAERLALRAAPAFPRALSRRSSTATIGATCCSMR